MADKKNYHYFGSTAFNWATGESRAEVLEKLARNAGSTIIKENVKRNKGLYAWTVRVDQCVDLDYQINSYQPQEVPLSNAQEFNIVNTKGHVIPIDREAAQA